MIATLALVALMALSTDVPVGRFQNVLNYANPKDEDGLIWPNAFAPDGQGGLFALDLGNKAVYQWDKTGHFIKKIGGPGLGPGELNLGDKWGMIAVNQRHILVFDEKKIHFWSRQGVYEKTENLTAKGYGRWVSFAALGDGFLVMDLNWSKNVSRLLILDQNFDIRKEVFQVPGGIYQKNSKQGWDFNPFAAKIVVGVSQERIFFGNWTEPKMFPLHASGAKGPKLLIPLRPIEVPPEEVQEQNELFARRRPRAEDRLVLPQYLPLYSAILPLDNDLVCIAAYDRAHTHCRGIALDSISGKIKASFDESLGNDMGLFVSLNGKVLMVKANTEGLYQLNLASFIIESKQ